MYFYQIMVRLLMNVNEVLSKSDKDVQSQILYVQALYIS